MKLPTIKKAAVSAVMAMALSTATFVAVPQAFADDHAQCQRKIEKAESKLDQAIRRHGERSRQADQRRRDLNVERERCFTRYHGWWDGRDHRWHDDRDWDHH